MFNINNKNLISFIVPLLTIFAFAIVLIPKNVNAYSEQPNCEIINFDVSANNITSGLSSTLNWNTNNCNLVSISNIGNVNTSGSQTVYPTKTTRYLLTATGSNGFSLSQSKTINVEQLNCQISNFNASSNYITSGESSILNWNTNNCNLLSISSIGNVNISGSQTVYPKSTTTYVLTANGLNGDRTQTVTINVEQSNCEILNFDTTKNYIISGQPSTLNWNTNYCNSVRISSLGNVDTRGSNTVYPRQTTKYLLTAIGINGYSISRSINITVTQAVVSSTSNNTNSTNNTTKNTVTNNSTNTTKNVTESSDNQTSALASNALFGSNGFLPSSLFGWLFFAVLILLAVVLWRKLYVSDEDKHHSTLKHA